ncbi:hypothetical protein [Mesorhizobium sp. 131-3-5]|uniref:hypothetical protein n=1 Tax=Mesorhizobium sp. 131-3-5 TaxID=2744520 RepID=UPI00192925C5|nr:hypothetical protein [Mesorhizobium sp. 131-3-5]
MNFLHERQPTRLRISQKPDEATHSERTRFTGFVGFSRVRSRSRSRTEAWMPALGRDSTWVLRK